MTDKKITQLTAKTTPIDADVLPLVDSTVPETKKVTWANIKATLNTYFTTLFTPSDGWNPDSDTWTYVSATSFKINSKNVVTRFPKGTKIKLTQTTTKYFYVVSAVFSTNTTVTVTGGSDYSLANAAITAPNYSYSDSPQAFPYWMNWTPSLTGYSSNPTNAVYRFAISDGKVYVSVREGTNGTSSSAAVNISLPVTASTITNQIWMFPASFVDNNVISTTWGRGVIASGATAIVFGTNPAQQDGFTTSQGKRISSFEGYYEF